MADDKKPKIDLKARLNRAGAANPQSSAGGAGAIPPPSSTGGGSVGGGLPPPISSPPGMLVGPPPPFASPAAAQVDPSNPLAAVANVYRPSAPPPPRPQRIEMDESTVVEARRGGLRQGVIFGCIGAAITLAVGWVGGGASARGEARDQGKQSASSLGKDVAGTKDSLKTLADKLDAGRLSLVRDRKFPDTLAKDLGAINIDFGGDKLAGHRFSGITPDAMRDLTGYITDVAALNERKKAIITYLASLQKPLTEQFAAPAGQATLSQVVIISRDANGPQALLASLTAPIVLNAQDVTLPDSFSFADPLGSGNSKLDRYKSGDISAKPAAIPVVPKTFEKLCPQEKTGQVVQLVSQMSLAVRQINGDPKAADDAQMVTESAPGLLERADRLSAALAKAGE